MSEPLGGAQRFFRRYFPKWSEDMEMHSRQWMVRCPNCGFEKSVWEWGGIRYKAAGEPRWLRRCRTCGKIGWHKVYKRKPEGSSA
jgi:hypothetical protein